MAKTKTRSKSGYEIRKLIIDFNFSYNEAEYAAFMAGKAKTKKEREMWEEEESNEDDNCFFIAEEIKKLKPSKYMINKHVDLQDILEY